MKKLFAVALAIVMVLTLSASAVLAKPGPPPTEGPAGESNEAHINLWQLDWVCDPDCHFEGALKGGAWGRLKHNISGPTFDFVLNSHGLDPDTEYSLVLVVYEYRGGYWAYWAEEITSGTPNGGGELHIADSYDFGRDVENADVWLVHSDNLINPPPWTYINFEDGPHEYLFGTEGILNHDDTDVP